jgi:hypothetical protein
LTVLALFFVLFLRLVFDPIGAIIFWIAVR